MEIDISTVKKAKEFGNKAIIVIGRTAGAYTAVAKGTNGKKGSIKTSIFVMN